MRIKMIFNNFFLTFLAIITFHVPLFPAQPSSPIYGENDNYIQALASLLCHLQEVQDELNQFELLPSDRIQFSEHDVAFLWHKASGKSESNIYSSKITDASTIYEQAMHEKALGLCEAAKKSFIHCSNKLIQLWESEIDNEDHFSRQINLMHPILRKKSLDPNFNNNPYLSDDARKKMHRYLMPLRHPMRFMMDALFLNSRITVDKATFEEAGFHVLTTGPRSHVSVASHPDLPHYLVKVSFDTVLRKKHKKESWEWLVHRCEGAERVQYVIQEKQIKTFTVAKKWIYCLPAHPSPPHDDRHTRHLAVLLVTDMDLVSDSKNYHAWQNLITEQHLDDLYMIISRAKGSSYRPDNIAYTNKENFAFIDTEYPMHGPDFKSIRKYLASAMRDYWDRIVRNGGP